jgi:hypothetical protein
MSITFSLCSRLDDGSFSSVCPDSEAHRVCHGTCDDAEDFVAYGYCECVMDAEADCSFCSAGINVSNTNAAQILERLGIEFDYCGHFDPADLFGRAAVGNIGRDDSGIATTVEGGDGCATLIECGLRPGYFEDRLGRLAELAQDAIQRGMLVSWG